LKYWYSAEEAVMSPYDVLLTASGRILRQFRFHILGLTIGIQVKERN
jgi:hypothetical protein